MKIFKDSQSEKLAKSVFEMFEQEKKGKGKSFLGRLNEMFKSGGFFKLNYNNVLSVAQSFK